MSGYNAEIKMTSYKFSLTVHLDNFYSWPGCIRLIEPMLRRPDAVGTLKNSIQHKKNCGPQLRSAIMVPSTNHSSPDSYRVTTHNSFNKPSSLTKVSPVVYILLSLIDFLFL